MMRYFLGLVVFRDESYISNTPAITKTQAL